MDGNELELKVKKEVRGTLSHLENSAKLLFWFRQEWISQNLTFVLTFASEDKNTLTKINYGKGPTIYISYNHCNYLTHGCIQPLKIILILFHQNTLDMTRKIANIEDKSWPLGFLEFEAEFH